MKRLKNVDFNKVKVLGVLRISNNSYIQIFQVCHFPPRVLARNTSKGARPRYYKTYIGNTGAYFRVLGKKYRLSDFEFDWGSDYAKRVDEMFGGCDYTH